MSKNYTNKVRIVVVGGGGGMACILFATKVHQSMQSGHIGDTPPSS